MSVCVRSIFFSYFIRGEVIAVWEFEQFAVQCNSIFASRRVQQNFETTKLEPICRRNRIIGAEDWCGWSWRLT